MSNLDYMIEMTNVNKWYGDFHVLKDINLRVKKGRENRYLWTFRFW